MRLIKGLGTIREGKEACHNWTYGSWPSIRDAAAQSFCNRQCSWTLSIAKECQQTEANSVVTGGPGERVAGMDRLSLVREGVLSELLPALRRELY